MQVAGRVVVVTGGGSGIGRALCARLHAEGAAGVVVVDRDGAAAAAVAATVDGLALTADVADPEAVEGVVRRAERELGPVELFCSNAGVFVPDPDLYDAASADPGDWARGWAVNVMAHVHAARAMIPRYRARGGGYLLATVSAAGLLSQLGAGVYATTKHAAIGFAEHLAITHRDDGIRVSVLCPQAVDTAMIRGDAADPRLRAAAVDGVLTPAEVAAEAVRGIVAERFLILPHPRVLGYLQAKTADYDAWIEGMARLRARLLPPG